MYKIDASYKDLETVKRDVATKDEYMANILDIIKNNCDSIKIVKMNEIESKIPKNKTYNVNKEKKQIIAYPIERKILYAIAKIQKKDKIIKDKYLIINETLSELINVGNSINMVEPLRDFNGYSWTCLPQEIESIEHNIIYQNLRILIGHDFLNRWVKDEEYIMDYYEEFRDKLEELYGRKNRDFLIDLLSKISILLNVKFNRKRRRELLDSKEEVEEKLKEVENKTKFIEIKTKNKLDISKRIREIDKIISDKNLLQKEYLKRNENLPLEKKIFSMKRLSKIMQSERERLINELEELNTILKPKYFIEYTKELEEKNDYLKILGVENLQDELNNLIMRFQVLFLHLLKINIKKAETKQEIEKLIYSYRYYLLLPFNEQKEIFEVEELRNEINTVGKQIIDKAIDYKIIQKIEDNENKNYEILKNIFNVRIIKLEDSYLKITKEKDRYFLQIFDENIFEEKVEISKPDKLEIKPNKKISIWC